RSFYEISIRGDEDGSPLSLLLDEAEPRCHILFLPFSSAAVITLGLQQQASTQPVNGGARGVSVFHRYFAFRRSPLSVESVLFLQDGGSYWHSVYILSSMTPSLT
ncbi:hypothetical protein Ddye_024600, partial [Dipteronia dyeriana]